MAIDPPYRLDPFQNIVNVSWVGEGGLHIQYFIFRRNDINGYYWVSEQFVLDAIANRQTNITSKYSIQYIESQDNLSDLISRAQTLAGEWYSYWDIWNNYMSSGDWPHVQPNLSNPTFDGGGLSFGLCVCLWSLHQ